MAFDDEAIGLFMHSQEMCRAVGDQAMQADSERFGDRRRWPILGEATADHHFVKALKPAKATQGGLIDK